MIFILTVSDDVYVPDLVVDAVRARGEDAVRVDSDEFASAAFAISADVGADGEEFDVAVAVVAGGVARRPRRIWARRRWPGARSRVADEFRAGAVSQSRALLHAWLRARGDDVINAVDAEDRAEDKLLQLRAARAVGFAVPDTVVTNDPARVRAFVAAARADGGDVVTKLLSPLSSSFAPTAAFFYTSDVDDAVLAHVDEVVHAPQIFQRKVRKALELRVQVVGGEVFCGALPVDGTGGSGDVVDWRLQQTGRWQRHALSSSTADRCRALCRALGLITGAIDLVVDGGGAERFLEVNPAGEWGFLQRDLDLPIANALAALLTEQTAPDRSPAGAPR